VKLINIKAEAKAEAEAKHINKKSRRDDLFAGKKFIIEKPVKLRK